MKINIIGIRSAVHGVNDIRTKRRVQSLIWILFRWAFIIGIGSVILYPILYMASSAFRGNADVMDPSVIWIPKHYTLLNIRQAFNAMHYPTALANTGRIMMVSACIQVLVTAMVGYGFARFEFYGKKILFAIVIFTILVPAQTTIMPSFIQMTNFNMFGVADILSVLSGHDVKINLTNTPWVMYLPAILGMGLRSGLFIYMFRQFFRNIPKELEEAAIIDGCGPYRTFLRVMVPNAGAIFLTAFLFSLVWYWNEYYLTSLMLNDTPTITLALAQLQQSLWDTVSTDEYSLLTTRMQAGCLLTIIPPLVVYLIVQRKFTESIERSGIVG